jgi:hypothetical protein
MIFFYLIIPTSDYIAIATAIIALIGGVPGIISIINSFSRIHIHCYQISYGNLKDDNLNITRDVLFIPITVYNYSEKPISFVSVKAEIKLKNKSFDLVKFNLTESTPIKDYSAFNGQKINVLLPENNLQDSNILVTKENPKSGHLTFVCNDKNVFERIQKESFKINFTFISSTGRSNIIKYPFHQ